MVELNGGTPVPAWVFHDLRRTVASSMAALDTAPHVIEACLNHRSGIVSGVARVYNRYDFKNEKAEAFARWAQHIDRLEHGGSTDNVVRLHR
jgi:integrase